jgi:tetratricopeptide (TPR) repeat protein
VVPTDRRSARATGEALPSPIAELFRRVDGIDEQYPEQLESNSILLFEVLNQYTASVLVAAYTKLGLNDGGAAGAIKQLKGMPTLGVWTGCTRKISEALAEPKLAELLRPSTKEIIASLGRPLTPEMTELHTTLGELGGSHEGSESEAPFSTVAHFFDLCLTYRNRKAHGGARWVEQHVDRLAQALAPAITSLVRELEWLVRYPLYSARSITPDGAYFVHVGKLYAGDASRRDSHLPLGHQLPLQTLVFDPEDAAVPMSPFYQVLSCKSPQCLGPRVFSAARDFAADSAVYVHSLCGTEAASATPTQEAWADVFRSQKEKGARPSGVISSLHIEPADRAVVTGEKFTVCYRVLNLGREAIHDVAIHAELPRNVEVVKQSKPQREELEAGQGVDFEFVLRTHEDGKFTIPAGRLEYEPGAPAGEKKPNRVKRPLPEVNVPVVFRDFPMLVGRENELERLHQHWLHARTGRLRVAALAGNSGAGKTALSDTFLDELTNRAHGGATVLRTRCYEESLHPFSAIASLIQDYLLTHCDRAAVAPAFREVVGFKVEDALGREVLLTDLLAILARVTSESLTLRRSLDPATADLTSAWADGGRRAQLYAAVQDVFAHASTQRPLVIHIDDVHVMHKDAWRLLRYLVRQLERRPILFLLSLGVQAVSEEVAENVLPPEEVRVVLRQLGADTIPLAPLGQDKMLALFDALLPKNAVETAKKIAVIEFAQGYPSSLVETIRVLRAGGHITRRSGEWRLEGETEDLVLTRAFEDIIRQRYDSLDGTVRRVVENAAVLGKRFPREMLAELPVDNDRRLLKMELNTVLRQLKENYHLLREEGGTGGLEFEFTHPRIHELVYSQIETRTRREIHRAIALLLEQKETPDQWCLELAFHWLRAGDRARALGFLEMGAERLEKSMAYEEAIRSLDRALIIVAERQELRDGGWMLDTVRKLARLHWLSGNIESSIQLDRQNIERALELGRFRDACELYRILSITYTFRGDAAKAWGTAEDGRALAAHHGLSEQENKLSLQLGMLARDRRRFDEAEPKLVAARDYASRSGLNWLEADACRHLGILHRMKGDATRARECFDWAIGLFNGLSGFSRLFGLGMTYDNLAALDLQSGDIEAATQHLEKSLEYRRKGKDSVGISRGLHAQAKVLIEKGAILEARKLLEESLEIKRRMEDEEGIAKCRELEGQVCLMMNSWRAALEALENAATVYRRLDKEWTVVRVRVTMAEVHLAAGDVASAEELLTAVAAADSKRLDTGTRIEIELVKADMALRRGDPVEAQEHLNAILTSGALTAARHDGPLQNRIDAVHALVRIGQEDSAGAIALLNKVLERPACRDNPYVASRMLVILGKAYRKAGDLVRAEKKLNESISRCSGIINPFGEALAYDELGQCAMRRDDDEAAHAWFEKALAKKRLIDDEYGIAVSRALIGRSSVRMQADGPPRTEPPTTPTTPPTTLKDAE